MKILLTLLGMLLVCSVCGSLISFLLNGRGDQKKYNLHIGYAYTLIAFYLFYFGLGNIYLATLATILLPLILVAAKLISKPGMVRNNFFLLLPCINKSGHRQDFIYTITLSLAILLLAAWPYFMSGWGSYWHSGNYDMEDGLRGRDAYISQLIFDDSKADLARIMGDEAWVSFAKITGTLSKRAYEAETYKEWYAGDGFRFQYSSLGFWSYLFQEKYGLDILLTQSLMNLLLMGIGIYYLSRHAFMLPPIAAVAAAIGSVGCSFYLTTFFAGHVGSMMYGALIPALLYFLLSVDQNEVKQKNWLLAALFAVAIAYTYPHPLIIMALPLAAYMLSSNQKLIRKIDSIQIKIKSDPLLMWAAIAVIALVLTTILLGMWQVTESYRLRQEGQFRAWGYSKDWLVIPLMLGLIPSPMIGTIFAVSTFGEIAYWGLILISLALASLLIFAYLKAETSINNRFLMFFGAFWLFEYLVFRFFIVDSYYLYKFLYIHLFIFVIGIVSFVSKNRSRSVIMVFLVIVGANLVSDIKIANGIYHRAYNRSGDLTKRILQVDHHILEKSFVALSGGDAVSVRETLKANGIETKLDSRLASYFIVPANREPDITGAQFTETIANLGEYVIKRAPNENYLMIRTWFEPEQSGSDPLLKDTVFRWIGHGKNDNMGIYVIRPSSPEKMRGKFLRLCLEKGPSAPDSINMSISTGKMQLLKQFKLDRGIHCEWLPAEEVVVAEQPLILRSGAKGKSLLPYDDRVLLYRVFAVNWVDSVNDQGAATFFNAAHDIIKKTAANDYGSSNIPVLRLGAGWYPYEVFDGKSFRWAGKLPQIVVTGLYDGLMVLQVDLEIGPSHGAQPLELTLKDENNRVIYQSTLSGVRGALDIPIPVNKNQTEIFTLSTNSSNLPLDVDPRILNFRVFQLGLKH